MKRALEDKLKREKQSVRDWDSLTVSRVSTGSLT